MKSHTISPETRQKIRFASTAIWILLIALLATGCGSSASPATTDTSPPPISVQDVTSLREIPLKDTLQFQHLTTADGLSEGRVWDILQDRQGFMWFTTHNGPQSQWPKTDGYTQIA